MIETRNVANERLERIRSCLASALHTEQIELIDDSQRHAGHAGARDGRGHFKVRVVSEKFAGLKSLQRHQLVYRSLGAMMQTDIHALNIVALTPEESAGQQAQ